MTDQSHVAGLAPIRSMDARAGLPANRTKCLHLDRCHGQNNHRVVNCSLIEMQSCRIGQNDGGEFAFDVFGNRLAVCWHANKHSGMGLPPLSRELRENHAGLATSGRLLCSSPATPFMFYILPEWTGGPYG